MLKDFARLRIGPNCHEPAKHMRHDASICPADVGTLVSASVGPLENA